MYKFPLAERDLSYYLERICPGRVQVGVDLAKISWWRIGGRGKILVKPGSTEEVVSLRQLLYRLGIPSVVIGETSNLLFSDGPVNTVLIQISNFLCSFSAVGGTVTVAGGVTTSNLANMLASENLTGGEHFCDIPGTLGGLIAMNGGSNRQSIGDSVLEVEVVTHEGMKRCLRREDCDFGYRSSIFQRTGDLIVGARLKFDEGPGERQILAEMRRIRDGRREKFPYGLPNCGSVFKSSPELYESIGPPGKVIDSLGLLGFRIGDAAISKRHGNFFENLGRATAKDMLELICGTRNRIAKETGFDVRSEVRFVANNGKVVPADEACACSE